MKMAVEISSDESSGRFSASAKGRPDFMGCTIAPYRPGQQITTLKYTSRIIDMVYYRQSGRGYFAAFLSALQQFT